MLQLLLTFDTWSVARGALALQGGDLLLKEVGDGGGMIFLNIVIIVLVAVGVNYINLYRNIDISIIAFIGGLFNHLSPSRLSFPSFPFWAMRLRPSSCKWQSLFHNEPCPLRQVPRI